MPVEDVAVVETKEVSLDTLGMSDYKKARNDGATSVVTQKVETVEDNEADKGADAAEPKEASEQEKPKSKGGFQKRIDRLVKQAASLEEQLNAERAKNTTKTEEKKAAPVEGEPQRSEFGTEYEYLKALTRWEVKQEIKEQKETEAREATAAKEREYVNAYNEKAIEAAARYDDWKEVMSQDISIPAIVGEALVHTIKNGPDVAYYLGKHPDTCAEMMQAHPLEAVAMAVKISDQISKSGKDDDTADDEEEEKEEPKPAAKAKPVSKAPEPVKPIKGGSTKSSVPLDNMSMADYKKARAAGRIT